ncbi:MAG: glucose-6-phosphate isomerase [Bacteroidetes bacterium]|jgi:glucose-6-phosphate isomerase|nr:glucose-6-phosphate isomerase [Bacteroidota bacterium]
MDSIRLHIEKTLDFISRDKVYNYKPDIEKHNKALNEKTGKGNDFLGWVSLPSGITDTEIKDIQETASKLKSNSEVVVVIGIGGSYLGAKAVIDALAHSFSAMMPRKDPYVVFAGQNISEDYLAELQELLKDVNWSVVVISKSGTTTEPAIAFRVLREDLEKKYGRNDAKNRIVAITDASKGALRTLADEEGYKTYIIPDDIGGRFSVLTPVGLVPIAIAGFDIKALIEGARDMELNTSVEVPFEDNQSAIYAAVRNELYKNGKTTEIMVNYNPKLHFVSEWWKQLYGESEGKEEKGIFPASVDFTTDLHSMGQYIQEGLRNIFETVISVQQVNRKVTIPKDETNLDKLNYLAGKPFDHVNKMAELGTLLAHVDGGVPNIRIEIPAINEFYLGQLMYFFEKACGISGYVLGVNPFDQPGVEAYKKNMFALLEKPGFEEETKKIKSRV